MDYSRFRINIVTRIILLSGLIFSLTYVLINQNHIIFPAFLSVFIIISIVELVLYFERSNKNLTQFLEAIKYQDFTKVYTTHGKHYSGIQGLNEKFNEITEIYRDIKLEGEAFYRYLHTVTTHVQIGILSYIESGEISLINQTAKDILEMPYLSTINQIEKQNPELFHSILQLKSGEQKLIRHIKDNHVMHLAINMTEFKLNQKKYKLVSFQNITNEINQTELTSWKNLIRVLTHEIMNSVTPMLSLNKAMKKVLTTSEGEIRNLSSLNEEEIQDLYESLSLIDKRGSGLIEFVQSYKRITKVPTPKLDYVNVHELISDVIALEQENVKHITIEKHFDSSLKAIELDPILIEQVIINILLNAIDAVKHRSNPKITFKTQYSTRLSIYVYDNGSGISSENIENLFIPFFTTKKNGSGIGLSLSKEIMRLHNGTIRVTSELNKGSCVILEF